MMHTKFFFPPHFVKSPCLLDIQEMSNPYHFNHPIYSGPKSIGYLELMCLFYCENYVVD